MSMRGRRPSSGCNVAFRDADSTRKPELAPALWRAIKVV
jgi:hypothetical protein